jgi:hypothetical protein
LRGEIYDGQKIIVKIKNEKLDFVESKWKKFLRF